MASSLPAGSACMLCFVYPGLLQYLSWPGSCYQEWDRTEMVITVRDGNFVRLWASFQGDYSQHIWGENNWCAGVPWNRNQPLHSFFQHGGRCGLCGTLGRALTPADLEFGYSQQSTPPWPWTVCFSFPAPVSSSANTEAKKGDLEHAFSCNIPWFYLSGVGEGGFSPPKLSDD